ncbi:MAG TPA: thioredoxin family protein [Actinomycetes bacterium]|nr:thioredoxin family protein [Actinomycetes bacterium]
MALASRLAPLGTPAPTFQLPDLAGRHHALDDYANHSVLVVSFVCNHCPYVQHIESELGAVAARTSAGFVAVCSNDAATYPDDAPALLAEQARRADWRFDYLVDADQSVARAFGAVCTPDFFVYGPDRKLAYRGAFDAATPKNGEPVNGSLLEDAISRILGGQSVPEPHRPSMGCGIKWLPGNEPT